MVASICGIALISALSFGGVLSYSYIKSLRVEFYDRVSAEGEGHSIEVYSFLNRAMARLSELGRDNSIRVTMMLGVDYPLAEKLTEYDQVPPGVDYFILRKGDDKIFSSTSQKYDEKIVREALNHSPSRSILCRSSSGKFITVFSVPIRSRSQIVGSAACVVDLSRSGIDSALQSSGGGKLFLFTSGKAFDLMSGKEQELKMGNIISDKMLLVRLDRNLGGVLYRSALVPGLSYFTSDTRLNRSITRAFLLSLPLLAIVTFLCLLIVLILSNKLGKPLRVISDAAEDISKGLDLDIQAKGSCIYEINALEKSLSSMLESLRKTKDLEEYQFFFDNVGDLVCITDLDGLFWETNCQVVTLLGYSREELLGKTFFELIPAHERSALRTVLHDILSGGLIDSFECPMVTKAGLTIHCEVRSRKIVYRGADVLLSVVRDVTDRKLDEEELQRYAAELLGAKEVEERNSAHLSETLKQLEEAIARVEVANQTKSEFLAQMSHEIRTPMNSILGMADMLRDTALSSEQKSYVTIFRDSGKALLALIDGILDLSKIESGKLTLEKAPFNLDTLVDEVSGIMSVTAWKKDLILACHIDPDTPAILIGDSTRIKQIIVNLLGNAIKFTTEGTVCLDISSRAESDGIIVLSIKVADTGIGIAEDKAEVIFENFTQADSSTTRKYGGTGLGLAITKNLVTLMNGNIKAQNIESGGALFTAEITVEKAEEDNPLDSRIRKVMQGRNVLVVDKIFVVRNYICKCLSSWGGNCIHVENSFLALDSIKASEKIDLVIISEKLGDEDGLGEVEAIKEGLKLPSPAVCLLSSSPGDSSNRPEINKLFGVRGSARWPLTRGVLLNAMLNLFEPVDPEFADSAVEKELLPTRILLAEDSEANRTLIEFFLKDTPFRITCAEDGAEAVAMYKKHNYDLVLMDIQMPNLNGYEATREIRAYEKMNGYPETPVVALTANESAHDSQLSLDAGCSGHLSKPIKKITLVKNILKFTS
ncbi:hybrid sensor histidine kinase/response regulator [Desulfovibrio gilichinskyi]|uniref:Sensory/regulatory protein RpfC n=1 Tax=Desulfovibrio gilichinskyi TaxID=1519643 RepID=A0A1X7DM59_9BACT|nr:response regulator [Desulfovibrio gilichinskyi]SMF17456.1 PAS domain S-box-containing protein [Desulfovibrio gilichinskyi]